MITVGGVDTYYDYNEQCWKYRRLGGGPIRPQPTSAGTMRRPEDDHGAEQQARGSDEVSDHKRRNHR